MHFGKVPLSEAEGHISAHKLFSKDGKKLLNKGHKLTAIDIDTLNEAGFTHIIVAQLAPSDLHENEAARLVAEAVSGEHIKFTTPGVGRGNLTAEVLGPVQVNAPLLARINNVDEGITIATLREHTLAHKGDLVALVKIITFGVDAARVKDVVAMTREAGSVISVRKLEPRSIGLIVTGPKALHEKLIASLVEPVRNRLTPLGAQLDTVIASEHDVASIANSIAKLNAQAVDLIGIAGYSATMDRADVAPTALCQAGGNVAHFGVPVDPGSLMMLGYLEDVPILGLPGCVKSPKFSIIDMVLPRLLAGERLTRADLVVLGHGGLLPDIKQRPMPRSKS